MRLYSLTEASAVDDGGVHYEPAEDGGFDFPGPLSDRLHATHVRGQKQWETAIERQHRLIEAEMARQRSPEALYQAVQQLITAGQAMTAAADPEPGEKPKTTRGRKPAAAE